MDFSSTIRILSNPIARRLFRPLMRERATIFMLHRLDNPTKGIKGHSVEFVADALRALLNSGAHFVSVRSMIEQWNAGREVDPNAVAFTFDDGFADQGELLRKAFLPIGCPATVFLITDFLDGKLWPWDNQIAYIFKHTNQPKANLIVASQHFSLDLSSLTTRRLALEQVREMCKNIPNKNLYAQVREIATQLEVDLPQSSPCEYLPIAWEEVRSLASQGIDFGPHSLTHRIFSQLSTEEVHEEITGSWRRLNEELSNPLPVFAWPTGRQSDYEQKDIWIAQQTGLKASMATNDDYSHVPLHGDRDDLFKIRRFAFPNSMPTVLRYGSWIERARQLLFV